VLERDRDHQAAGEARRGEAAKRKGDRMGREQEQDGVREYTTPIPMARS
jgi:hypothetical protein